MAKFVKLENGNYVNIDKIINIAPQQYEYLYGSRDRETSDDEFGANIFVGYGSPANITITRTDVDNILKASESKNDSGGEKKISKETLKIAINAMKNESADLGLQAGFALETDAPGAESYYRDCEEQDAILREAIDELEEYGGVHFGGGRI